MSSAASAPSRTLSIAATLLDEFEREIVTTRRFLERVPPDRLDWRPHEKSMSAGELALHVASIPAGVLEMALRDSFTPPDFAHRERPDSVGAVLGALDRGADYVRRTLPGIDDGQMRDPVSVVAGGRTLMSLPRGAFLRAIMLNHWYHHRGQLGVYLRLLGAAVPSSYGPSGDEAPPGMAR
jgi:uncharacterized damage-inducible protein DinB